MNHIEWGTGSDNIEILSPEVANETLRPDDEDVTVDTLVIDTGSAHIAIVGELSTFAQTVAERVQASGEPWPANPHVPTSHGSDWEVSDDTDESGPWIILKTYAPAVDPMEADPPVLSVLSLSDVEADILIDALTKARTAAINRHNKEARNG